MAATCANLASHYPDVRSLLPKLTGWFDPTLFMAHAGREGEGSSAIVEGSITARWGTGGLQGMEYALQHC